MVVLLLSLFQYDFGLQISIKEYGGNEQYGDDADVYAKKNVWVIVVLVVKLNEAGAHACHYTAHGESDYANCIQVDSATLQINSTRLCDHCIRYCIAPSHAYLTEYYAAQDEPFPEHYSK